MLADRIAEATFGRGRLPSMLTIGLEAGPGIEVDDPGYARQIAEPGSWTVEGSTATTAVVFGPFVREASFRSAVLYGDGGEILIPLPFETPVRIPAGSTFAYRAEVRIGG